MKSPDNREGVCIWFTGLSGAGKSTTAEVLMGLLQARGCTVKLLDGPMTPTTLTLRQSVDKTDRDSSVRKIGFMAAEVVRQGDLVVCAALSAYRPTRDEVRKLVGSDRFVEVFVDTPLEECERRDTKGMYAKAKRGVIKNFVGVDPPYEAPQQPEIRLETIGRSADENAHLILSYLIEKGFV